MVFPIVVLPLSLNCQHFKYAPCWGHSTTIACVHQLDKQNGWMNEWMHSQALTKYVYIFESSWLTGMESMSSLVSHQFLTTIQYVKWWNVYTRRMHHLNHIWAIVSCERINSESLAIWCNNRIINRYLFDKESQNDEANAHINTHTYTSMMIMAFFSWIGHDDVHFDIHFNAHIFVVE